MTTDSRSESWEQRELIQYIKKYPWGRYVFHICNESVGGYAWQVRNRQLGVRKGVPDLFLPIPMNGRHGLFVEMKREKGGSLSREQRMWINLLSKVGYQVEVCHGWKQAAETMERYMHEGNQDN